MLLNANSGQFFITNDMRWWWLTMFWWTAGHFRIKIENKTTRHQLACHNAKNKAWAACKAVMTGLFICYRLFTQQTGLLGWNILIHIHCPWCFNILQVYCANNLVDDRKATIAEHSNVSKRTLYSSTYRTLLPTNVHFIAVITMLS